MSHIGVQVSTDLVTNISESLVVKITWISRVASDDKLWLELHGGSFQSIIVDDTGIEADLVLLALEELGRCRDLSGFGVESVSEMTTLCQVKSHQTIAGLEKSSVNGQVGWRSGVSLNIGSPFSWVETVKLECSVSAQVLDLVNELISSVVPGSWITLTILVGKA